MMAAKARREHGSAHAPGANQSQSGVSCSCTLSSPVSSIIPASHADLLFNLPQANLIFKLPLSIRCAGTEVAFLAVPEGRLPDPPPKALSIV